MPGRFATDQEVLILRGRLIGSALSGLPDKVFLPSTKSRIVGGDSLLPALMGRVTKTADRVSGGWGKPGRRPVRQRPGGSR
jgi:hypothetical protein